MGETAVESNNIGFKPSKHPGFVVPEHPLYAEALDESFVYRDSPIVKAAYDVAAYAHDGQGRNIKCGMNQQITYITHPVMVCKLLQQLEQSLPEKYQMKMRLTGEISLAVALLHDVLEDNEKYKKHPEKLREDLYRQIVAHVFVGRGAVFNSEADIDKAVASYPAKEADEIKVIVNAIIGDCEKLRNPSKKEMLYGKRTFQVEHMDMLGERASLIKMLDQMASCIEDVVFKSAREHEQIHQFFRKAMNIIKAGAEHGSDAHRMVEQMFLRVDTAYRDIALEEEHDPGKISPKRAQFKIENIMQEALSARIEALTKKVENYQSHATKIETGVRQVPAYTEIFHPGIEGIKVAAKSGAMPWPDYGITAVKIRKNEDGEAQVIGFSMRQPSYNPKNMQQNAVVKLASKAQTVVLSAIERLKTNKEVAIGSLRPTEGTMVREYWLEQPLTVSQFLDSIRHAGIEMKRDIASDPVKSEAANNAFYEVNPVLSFGFRERIKREMAPSRGISHAA